MSDPSDDSFATTQWTRVLAARGDSNEARIAFSELCETYYAPVRKFIHHQVDDPNRGEDLAQEFFAGLLRRDSLAKLERNRGKFRSYLLGAVKHFLSDDRKHQNRQKRGGQNEHVSISEHIISDPRNENAAPSSAPAPDSVFDQEWALTLLGRTMDALAAEELGNKRGEQFKALKPWLTGELGDKTQREAAIDLGLTVGATKVAVHRLRLRFRSELRKQIGDTVESDQEIQEELSYLIQVLANCK